ncbi:MAG TPA: sulfite exporter TauE/SafE family protein [Polyangiaceae bacterium]|jgi:hypothetical protein
MFDPLVMLSGLLVGLVVGLTGMGGGALMTPLLVLGFGIEPLAAVSSDLVASLLMKPLGAWVHWRRGTVRPGLVRWLVMGSVPSAFVGSFVSASFGSGAGARLKLALGFALLVASSAIAAKAAMGQARAGLDGAPDSLRILKLPTLAVGVVGGFVVGLTSVGSGSLMMVLLLLLYPRLSAGELVGTDLVQAIPLVGAAALGHIIFGDFKLGLTSSLVIGGVPGVYIGAQLSARAPDKHVRPILMVVLLATGLKLVGMPALGIIGAVVLALVAWLVTALARRRKLTGDPASRTVVP